MFVRWRKLDDIARQLVWPLYGRFTGLMFVGSCFGSIAWLCNMQTFAFNFHATSLRNDDAKQLQVQIQTAYAQQSAWQAAFLVFYAMDFLFLSSAQLLILHRMLGFIGHVTTSLNIFQQSVDVARMVMTIVVVGNVIGLLSNVVAAAFSARASALNLEAAAAWEANPTNTTKFVDLVIQYGTQYQNLARAQSVQQFSEVLVLLMIILAFSASGALAIKRLRASAKATGSAGARLQRKILGTVAVVFCSFLLRTIFSIMNAVSNALQNNQVDCSGQYLCSPCYNVYTNMQVWFSFTPEFQLVVILISSPMASLVALWGMTSDRAKRLLATRATGLERTERSGK
jgi:hypothetical protein